MTAHKCACGFTEDAGEDYTIADHLQEMFTPQDCVAADGTLHAEGLTSYLCMCGAGGSQQALDEHFLAAFTPADSVAPDGTVHKTTSATPVSPPA
jgi:hypothetical protein